MKTGVAGCAFRSIILFFLMSCATSRARLHQKTADEILRNPRDFGVSLNVLRAPGSAGAYYVHALLQNKTPWSSRVGVRCNLYRLEPDKSEVFVISLEEEIVVGGWELKEIQLASQVLQRVLKPLESWAPRVPVERVKIYRWRCGLESVEMAD